MNVIHELETLNNQCFKAGFFLQENKGYRNWFWLEIRSNSGTSRLEQFSNRI